MLRLCIDSGWSCHDAVLNFYGGCRLEGNLCGTSTRGISLPCLSGIVFWSHDLFVFVHWKVEVLKHIVPRSEMSVVCTSGWQPEKRRVFLGLCVSYTGTRSIAFGHRCFHVAHDRRTLSVSRHQASTDRFVSPGCLCRPQADKNDVYILPESSMREWRICNLPALGAALTVPTQEHTDSQSSLSSVITMVIELGPSVSLMRTSSPTASPMVLLGLTALD